MDDVVAGEAMEDEPVVSAPPFGSDLVEQVWASQGKTAEAQEEAVAQLLSALEDALGDGGGDGEEARRRLDQIVKNMKSSDVMHKRNKELHSSINKLGKSLEGAYKQNIEKAYQGTLEWWDAGGRGPTASTSTAKDDKEYVGKTRQELLDSIIVRHLLRTGESALAETFVEECIARDDEPGESSATKADRNAMFDRCIRTFKEMHNIVSEIDRNNLVPVLEWTTKQLEILNRRGNADAGGAGGPRADGRRRSSRRSIKRKKRNTAGDGRDEERDVREARGGDNVRVAADQSPPDENDEEVVVEEEEEEGSDGGVASDDMDVSTDQAERDGGKARQSQGAAGNSTSSSFDASWRQPSSTMESDLNNLLFHIHQQRFLSILIRAGDPTAVAVSRLEALQYGREHLTKFTATHLKELQRLFGCLLFSRKLAESPYADLVVAGSIGADGQPTCALDNTRLRDEFITNWCCCLGMSRVSPLSVVLDAGALALVQLLKLVGVMEMTNPHGAASGNNTFTNLIMSAASAGGEMNADSNSARLARTSVTSANGQGQSSYGASLASIAAACSAVNVSHGDGPSPAAQGELPIEIHLGDEYVFQSIFSCPVSREQSTATNPPFLLPCGHVLCKGSVLKLARGAARVFKCPYCPKEATMGQCRELHL